MDGDTIRVLHDGKREKVRLARIDCPEYRQPYWRSAKNFTNSLVYGEMVTIKVKKKDRDGRTVGEVILSDGRNLGEELIKAGLAWHYKRYSKREELDALEKEARDRKRGLWSDPDPISPWEWREEYH